MVLLDDDVIFGRKWIDHALTKVEQHYAAVSSWTAVVRESALKKSVVHYINAREEIRSGEFDTETDIFGHWFIFRRSWINYFFSLPPATIWTGEDLSFPFLGQELSRMKSIAVSIDTNDVESAGEQFTQEVEQLQDLASGKSVKSQVVRASLLLYLVKRNWVIVEQRSHPAPRV